MSDIYDWEPLKLSVKKLNKEGGILQPQKVGDVGYDLITSMDTLVPARSPLPIDVPTGVSIKLPTGYWGLVVGRSGAIRKSGLSIKEGVIDNGYTGEIYACCRNTTHEDITVLKGTKLAQLVLFYSHTPEIEYVDELPETNRGDSGFGSTDKQKT